jgi:hypothetical protein
VPNDSVATTSRSKSKTPRAQHFDVTVEFIEDRTGVNFFGRLPEGLADDLKEYRVQFDGQGNPKSFN